MKNNKEFPPRDTTKPAEAQGLFNKFNVSRTDGSDAPGGKHFGARYFVIDMDSDKHAPAALVAYAIACSGTHPVLAAELKAQYPTGYGDLKKVIENSRVAGNPLQTALDYFRDTILNQRGALAENGMTNDQINDVLCEFDAHFSVIKK